MPWEGGDPGGGLEECGKHRGRQQTGGSVSPGKGDAAVRALGWGLRKLGFTTNLLRGAGQVSFLLGALIWVSPMEQTHVWVYLEALSVRKLALPHPVVVAWTTISVELVTRAIVAMTTMTRYRTQVIGYQFCIETDSSWLPPSITH